MTKHCCVMEVRPGYEEEYKRRHDEIWPDLVNDIRAAGLTNFSIWRYGLLLIAYFEAEDFDEAIGRLQASDINKRWSEFMEPIMKLEVDPNTGFLFQLPCMWDLAAC